MQVPARTVTAYAAYTSTFDPRYDLAVIRLNKDVGACTGGQVWPSYCCVIHILVK